MLYAFAELQKPQHMPNIHFSLSNHISADALIGTMHYYIEIHRTFVYAFAEFQNLQHMPIIWFSLNNHISAEALTEKMHYTSEIHGKNAYAVAEFQNPKQMPKLLFPLSNHVSAEALQKRCIIKLELTKTLYMHPLKSRIPNTCTPKYNLP